MCRFTCFKENGRLDRLKTVKNYKFIELLFIHQEVYILFTKFTAMQNVTSYYTLSEFGPNYF